MTPGQQRAIDELRRIHAIDPDSFEVVEDPFLVDGWLKAVVSLRLGPMQTSEGGLQLREREDFILWVPPDFPFDSPRLAVAHDRFSGFPHVTWGRWICLYQTKLEWNPADGLCGFCERLRIWLGRAAINDMDPVDGPLEPPHYAADFSQLPFVIRANTPVEAGDTWIGLAELQKHDNRMELLGWNDLSGDWPKGRQPALAVVLPKALPMEFPRDGKDFFSELAKQGITQQMTMGYLRVAASFGETKEPAFLILAIPGMRRSRDGKPKHHVAVWATDAETAERLRKASPSRDDTQEIKVIQSEINELIYQILELSPIKWCVVMENRDEIVASRDAGTPVAWFAGKNLLILGCGALGSWIAESAGRANPKLVHLVDNSMVKPGLLSRQNYESADIGAHKAVALAKRIQSVVGPDCLVQAFPQEAYAFLRKNQKLIAAYDFIADSTASPIFQMKLERDWRMFGGQTPLILSLIIDSKAQRCLSVLLPRNSSAGVWDAYVRLKYMLCFDGGREDIVSAFYSERSRQDLFQPEPGCSEPTFSGSMADVSALAHTSLNLALAQSSSMDKPVAFAFSTHAYNSPGQSTLLELPSTQDVTIGQYKVRIDSSVYTEAMAWVRENNRLRSLRHETGGLVWGLWDDAAQAIWLFQLSGPPSDSIHDPGHFVCGKEGTLEQHKRRTELSHGACGFVGFWHTHPDMPSQQSFKDLGEMAILVSRIGWNQKRCLMLIFGRTQNVPTAGIFVFESQSIEEKADFVSVGSGQFTLARPVV